LFSLQIAKLLELGKEEKARIRAEHLIREDFTMEALEIIQLLCELVHERCKHLVHEKECPADLLGAVATLIYSARRVDVSELDIVHRQLIKKYGTKFAEEVTREDGGAVNPRIIEKLAVRPPSAEAVVEYLKRIAAEFNIEWTPTIVDIADRSGALPAPVGFSVPMAPGTSYADVYRATSAANGSAGTMQV
jgi:vacuolar protein sorting-associated protein IST1